MRITIELPDDLADALASCAKRLGVSSAELLSQAIGAYLVVHRPPAADDPAFGLWRDHGEDGLRHQRQLRAEWER